MTFGLAAWLKWSQGMPDWFVKQFGGVLSASLAFSLFVFVLLAYGSRLTGKFEIAGWNYLYLLGTLLTLQLVGRQPALPQPHRR